MIPGLAGTGAGTVASHSSFLIGVLRTSISLNSIT
jgi:hypothetical protein